MLLNSLVKKSAALAAGFLSLLAVSAVHAVPTTIALGGTVTGLTNPSAVAVDAVGNVYFVESNGHLTAVTPPLSTTPMKTAAGTNFQYTVGAGGALGGVAVDSAGNVYVTETANNKVWKVTPAGVATVLAGGSVGSSDGTGSQAQFNGPTGIAVDVNGNVYVSDTGNYTIRKITSAGVVSTYAGAAGVPGTAGGAALLNARFTQPTGLAVDTNGNLFLADTAANTIREINTGGNVTTIGGNGTSGNMNGSATSTAEFAAPKGVAVDSSDNVYVADTGNSAIRLISGGSVTTLLASGISGPAGIALDTVGNWYIADTGNNVVRSATQSVPTLPGVSPSFITQPANATMVAGNTVANVILSALASGSPAPAYQWEFSLNGGTSWTNATNGAGVSGATSNILTLSGATALAAANTGEQFRVMATNASAPSGVLSQAATVTLNAWGFLANAVAGTQGTAAETDGNGTAAAFNNPVSAAAGLNSMVYVVDSAGDTVRQVSSGSSVVTVAGTAGTASYAESSGTSIQFNHPTGIAADTGGNLYIADSGNYLIRKLTLAGSTFSSSTIAGTQGVPGTAQGTGTSAQFINPTALCVDGSLNIYVADTGANTISKITAGGVVTLLAGSPGAPGSTDGTGTSARFNAPGGIAVDSAGNVYVADTGNNEIRKITPAGEVTTLAGSTTHGSADGVGAAAGFYAPHQIVIGPSGNLYVADTNNNEIRFVTPSGIVITVAGTTTAGHASGTGTAATFSALQGLAIDSSSTLTAADTANELVRHGYPNATAFVAPSALTTTTAPASIQIPAGAGTTFTVVESTTSPNIPTPAPSYQWQLSTNSGTSFSNLTDGGDYSGSQTASLTVSNANTSMSGYEYQVIIANAAGSYTPPAVTLTVNTPPQIISQPSSQVVTVGGTINLSVTANPSTGVSYQWYFNSSPISGATSSSLSISGATASNAGSYFVIVADNGGATVSSTATIGIGTPPSITVQPSNQSIGLGQSATFTVISSDPNSTYQWYFNGSAIGGANSPNYTVTNASTSNVGNYYAVVTNSAGSVQSSTVSLTVTQLFYPGVYFGTFSSGGNWALDVNSDNTGTFIAYLSGSQSAIVQNVTISSSGSFSLSGTSVTSTGAAHQAFASPTSYSISGQISGTTVTGTGAGGSLNGAQDVGSTETYVAGAYSAKALLTSTSNAYAIVGGDGQALFVWVGPSSADAATGTVNGSGALSGTTFSGAGFSMNIGGQGQFTGSFTPVGSTTASSFGGISAASTDTTRLVNLSARANVGTGLNVLAAGFSIGGTGQKQVLLRGAGPALGAAPFNLTGTLASPILTVYSSGATVLYSNSSWGNLATLSSTFAQVGAFSFANGSNDTAILQPFSPGVYSEQVSGANGTSGVALAEIYDADTASVPTTRLANISARANVTGQGLNTLAAGFSISGNNTETVLIRGIGPALTGFNVTGAMQTPTLTVYNASGAVIASNTGWSTGTSANTAALQTDFAQTGAFGLTVGSADCALQLTLNPGVYSATVAPNGTSAGGIALIEVYEVAH